MCSSVDSLLNWLAFVTLLTTASAAAALTNQLQTIDASSENTSSSDPARSLQFTPEENGIRLTSPQLKWKLTDGRSINLSGLIFSSSQIGFSLERNTGASEKSSLLAFFRWPEILAKSGKLFVIGPNRKILWERVIDEDARWGWARALKNIEGERATERRSAQWGETDPVPGEWDALNGVNSFRACFRSEQGTREQLTICTGQLQMSDQGTVLTKELESSASPDFHSSVEVNGVAIGDEGTVNFPPNQNLLIKTRFANGSSVEISGEPLKLDLLDATAAPQGSTRLVGQGPKPFGATRDLLKPVNRFYSATGSKREVVWEALIPADTPTVRVRGSFNVPFTYLFSATSLPREEDRPKLGPRPPDGTYTDDSVLDIASPQGSILSSAENSIERQPDKRYRWKFKAQTMNALNRAHVSVTNANGKTWNASYQMYRAYAREISTRITGFASVTEQIFIGEVAGSAWFEDIGSANSYWLSRKRWGLAGRYLQSFNQFAATNGQTSSGLRAFNVDLKYNFIPGLANHDELVGAMVSAQNVDAGGLTATLGGVGGYWARTMPKFLDDVLSVVPGLRSPKYLDIEFIYFPLRLTGDVLAGASYNFNVHGKIFWTPRFFGEAGIGIRQYVVTSSSLVTAVQLSVGYGTLGVGWIF